MDYLSDSPLLMDTGEDDTFYKPIGSSLTLHLSFRSHSKFNTSVNWTHIANDEVYKELEYSLIHVKNQLHSCSTSVEIDNIGITDFGVYRCLMYNGLLSTVEKQFQLYIGKYKTSICNISLLPALISPILNIMLLWVYQNIFL